MAVIFSITPSMNILPISLTHCTWPKNSAKMSSKKELKLREV